MCPGTLRTISLNEEFLLNIRSGDGAVVRWLYLQCVLTSLGEVIKGTALDNQRKVTAHQPKYSL